MIGHDRTELHASASEYRYAGFGTVDGFVVYDTEEAAAWIESDTTVDPAEVR